MHRRYLGVRLSVTHWSCTTERRHNGFLERIQHYKTIGDLGYLQGTSLWGFISNLELCCQLSSTVASWGLDHVDCDTQRCAESLVSTTCGRVSKTANFAPVSPPGDLNQTTVPDVRLMSPPGELDETYVSSLIRAQSLHYIENGNMTLSTKLEVHNVSHFSQKRIEPRQWVTRTEKLVKFGRVVSEKADKQTNKQTNRHGDHNISQPPSPWEAES